MTKFQVLGPFEVPVQSGAGGRCINDSTVYDLFKKPECEPLSKRIGCYVFAIRAGRGFTPMYVGKAAKGLAQECFGYHKLEQYNKALTECTKGTPVMFFVVAPEKAGVAVENHVAELEKYLIHAAYHANPNLLNVRCKKESDWSIAGIVRGTRGKTTKGTAEFRKMMDLDG